MKRKFSILLLLALSAVIYVGNAAKPPLLDDADSAHALVSHEMLQRGDWVVMYQDGVRYLQKAPVQFWMVAVSYKLFGEGAFQTRLPLALAVIGLVLMAYFFTRDFFGERAGLYAGLATCTSAGIFLFTRIMIPEAIFALEMTAFFYIFLLTWNKRINTRIGCWSGAAIVAVAVLTLGLIGVLFPLGILFFFLLFTRSWNRWRELHLFSSTLIFLIIAVPWHVIAEHRSPGFYWSYFINEHFKRALGTRYPPDYEATPLLLWWGLHLVWFFPWSLFLPYALREFPRFRTWGKNMQPEQQARLLLFIWAGLIMFFFSLTSGSRMEYYSFGAWPAIAILLGIGLAHAEELHARWLTWLQGALSAAGIAVSAVLGYLVWSSLRVKPQDVGNLIQYQPESTYRLSMAHFLDLTSATFAIFRGPALLAMVVFVIGFGIAWILRRSRKNLASTLTIAVSMGIFCFAANWAFQRFSPRLSSYRLAEDIRPYLGPQGQIVEYGDFNNGSSIPYYLNRHVWIYNGRYGTGLEYGSTYRDVPPTFLDDQQFSQLWNSKQRVFLFVPEELRSQALSHLPPDATYVFAESGGKYIFVNDQIKANLPLLATLSLK